MFLRYAERLDASIQTPALNRQREGAGPSRDFFAKLNDASDLTARNLGLEVLQLVGFLREGTLNVLADLDTLVNVLGNALKVTLAETTARHGWCTDTDTAGGQSALVTGNRVLVASNVDLLKNSLKTSTVQAVLAKVNKHHVAVSSVGDELVTKSFESLLQSLCIGYNFLLIRLKFRCLSLLQGNGQGSNGVVVRTTLMTGEDGEVDGALEIIKGLFPSLGVN